MDSTESTRTNCQVGSTIVFFPSQRPNNQQHFGISLLPPRPTQPSLFKERKVITNLYHLTVPENTFLHAVQFDIKPAPPRNKKFTKWISDSIEASITSLTQYPPLKLGRRFYTWHKLPTDRTTIHCEYESERYTCTVQECRSFPWRDLFSNSEELRKAPLGLLNRVLGQLMRQLGYQQLASSKTFFNRNKIMKAKPGVFLYEAYHTEFVAYEKAVFLRIDPIRKVFRQPTVLEHIDEIYVMYKSEPRECKRARIGELVRNKLVVTCYGKRAVWRVQGVAFETDATSMSSCVNSTETLADYYKRKYGINIQKTHQPMLLALNNSKQPVLLIPELLYFIEPASQAEYEHYLNYERISDRITNTINLASELGLRQSNPKLVTMMQSINLTIEPTPTLMDCELMPEPVVRVGGQVIEEGKVKKFWMKDKRMYEQPQELRLLVVLEQSAHNCYEDIVQTAEIMKVKMKFQSCPLKVLNLRSIKDALANSQQQIFKANAAIIILPVRNRDYYPDLKQFSYKLDSNFATQIILESSMRIHRERNACAISSALCQLAAKLSAIPWHVQIPVLEPTMMVGFYKLACGSSPNKSILTICASTDNKHTKFYSNLAYQSSQLTPGFEDMARLFGEALNAYRSTNNRLPSEIVILRARRSFDEENWASEVNSLLQALKIHTRNFEFEPRVTYIYYDTEPKETFTCMRAGREENSIAGTVVRKAVTSSSYDFYISCGQSYEYLSRPTYYKVLYCTSLWPEDRLQQFIYSQCFNYMGISGVNRLPAVCRYAKRLVYFVNTLGSDCRIQFDKLTHQLFYL